MIDMPSGFDWYDGAKKDGRRPDPPRRPRRSKQWRHIGGRRVRVME